MSFNSKKFFRLDVGMQEQYINRMWNYRNDDDVIATVVASDYFSGDHGIQVNDLIYAVASDDKQLLVVDSLDPITTSDFVAGGGGGSVADGSITNAKLADGAVSGDKVAALGIASGKYAALSIASGDLASASVTKTKLHSDVASIVGIASHTLAVAATDTVTVTGALTSDVVWAILTEAGTGIDHGIIGAKVTSSDTVTLYSEGSFEAVGCMLIVMRPGT